ncbi:MAG: hypothetical protein KAS18_10825, partial [Calditrichia bacterium]|nr:hypothetical protein [Calditrichia bacterium]
DTGLYRFDIKQEKFVLDSHLLGSQKKDEDYIRCLFADKSGLIWVGVDNRGLYKINANTGQVIQFQNQTGNLNSLSSNQVESIFQDKSGMLWIGTAQNGLNTFNRTKEQFSRYQYDPGDHYSLSDNSILCIYEDRSGVLWYGTRGGINKFDPLKKDFKHYRHIPGNSNSLSNNLVTAIYESEFDGKKVLWVGTKGGGLNRIDQSTGLYKHYKHDPEKPSSLSNDNVMTIKGSNDIGQEKLWIGTYNGLNEFDINTEKFTAYRHIPENPFSISHNTIISLAEDNVGTLWIGTQDGGLNKLDLSTKQFSHFGIIDYPIQAILIDKSDILWLATTNGLVKFETDNETFTSYKHEMNDPNSIRDNQVTSICEPGYGEDNVLWIGTARGLNKFNRITTKFSHATDKEIKVDIAIKGILEDKYGNLWLSTNKGLINYELDLEKFFQYDVHSGLQGNQFSPGATFRSNSGEMFFGGINGLTAFYFDSLKTNPIVPNVVITDVKILNQQTKIITNQYQKRSIKALDFVSHEHGWLAGEGVLLKTEDGGKTWIPLTIDDEWEIQLIDFVNDSVGWAVEQIFADGKILKTMDGGKNWIVQKIIDGNYCIKKLYAVNDSVVFTAGFVGGTRYASGRILKTEDGGLSWAEVSPPDYRSDLYSVSFINNEIGIAIGTFGAVLKSIDGGKTWDKNIIPYLNFLKDLQLVNDSTGYFIADDHLLFSSVDNSNTWELKARDIASYYALNKNTIYAIKKGSIMKSLDGGLSWDEKLSDARDITLINFVDYSTGWIIGNSGTILKTIDGGNNWVNQSIKIRQSKIENKNDLSSFKPISHKGDIELAHDENYI